MKFYIYPNNDRFKVQVTVAKNAASLRRLYGDRTGKTCAKVLGFFQAQDSYLYSKGKETRTGLIGEIVLSVENLTLDIIAHECGHATHAYCRRKRKTRYGVPGLGADKNGSVNHPEEVFCYALGSMITQVCESLLRNGYKWNQKRVK